MADTTLVIALDRPIRPGWRVERACRVLPGRYRTARPDGRAVYVPGQVGAVRDWAFCAWEGTEPTAVRLYVRVRVG